MRHLLWISFSFLLLGMLAVPISASDASDPRRPNLSLQAPPQVAERARGAFGPWLISDKEMRWAAAYGASVCRAGKLAIEASNPWRYLVDPDGEYATILTPGAAASLLGYQAEDEAWPESLLMEKLAQARDQFKVGICIYLEARSYAHVGRQLRTTGQVIMPSMGEVTDIAAMLDAGGRKLRAASGLADVGQSLAVIPNSEGLCYELVQLPAVRIGIGDFGLKGEMRLPPMAADYYLWWPFLDEKGESVFSGKLDKLRLTVTTPSRKREFKLPLDVRPLPPPVWSFAMTLPSPGPPAVAAEAK